MEVRAWDRARGQAFAKLLVAMTVPRVQVRSPDVVPELNTVDSPRTPKRTPGVRVHLLAFLPLTQHRPSPVGAAGRLHLNSSLLYRGRGAPVQGAPPGPGPGLAWLHRAVPDRPCPRSTRPQLT